MMTPSVLIAGLVGLVVGSFLNVLMMRYRTPDSALAGRSRCPGCKHRLSWWELIPLVSYAILRGHCQACHKPIHWRYPLIEFVTALGTALIVSQFDLGFATICLIGIFWVALVIIGIDLEHMLIPDRAVLTLIGLGLIYQIALGLTLARAQSIFLGLLAGGGLLLLIVLVTRGRGMGMGDAKLGAAIGLILGWPLVVAGLFFAVELGAVIAILLLLFGGASWRRALPFAPFLLIGLLLAMIWGEYIVRTIYIL